MTGLMSMIGWWKIHPVRVFGVQWVRSIAFIIPNVSITGARVVYLFLDPPITNWEKAHDVIRLDKIIDWEKAYDVV